MPKKWVPLESNPDVLNQYIAKLGVGGIYKFCDVYGLDEDLLSMVPQPVKALIMCFPISEAVDAAAREEDERLAQTGKATPTDLFYLKQTIGNACGTIAVLHSLCNNASDFELAGDGFVAEFMKATSSMDPAGRGKYLEDPPQGGPDIEAAHQGRLRWQPPVVCCDSCSCVPRHLGSPTGGAARQKPVSTGQADARMWASTAVLAAAAEGDTAPPPEDEVINLHFVAFVHKDGTLWELDGRRKGPVPRGPTTPDTLLKDAAAVIQAAIARTPSLNFSLVALAADTAS